MILAALILIAGCATNRPSSWNNAEPSPMSLSPVALDKLVSHARNDIAKDKDLNAIQTLDAVIEQSPRSAEAFLCRGLAHYKTGNTMQAVFDFTRSIELNPSNPLTYFNRGTAKLKLQEPEKAAQDFTTCMELAPTFAMALNNRGLCNYTLKKNQAAIDDFSKAFALSGQTLDDAIFNRARVYQEMEMYAKALKDYEKAIKLNPNLAQAFNNMGVIRLRTARYEEAIAQFDKALTKIPGDPQVLYNRAIALENRDRYEQAIADYTQALMITPTFPQALHNRGVLYLRLNDKTKGCRDLKKACNSGMCTRYKVSKELGVCW